MPGQSRQAEGACTTFMLQTLPTVFSCMVNSRMLYRWATGEPDNPFVFILIQPLSLRYGISVAHRIIYFDMEWESNHLRSLGSSRSAIVRRPVYYIKLYSVAQRRVQPRCSPKDEIVPALGRRNFLLIRIQGSGPGYNTVAHGSNLGVHYFDTSSSNTVGDNWHTDELIDIGVHDKKRHRRLRPSLIMMMCGCSFALPSAISI